MITRDFVSRTTLIRNIPSLSMLDSAWCLTAHVIGLSAKHTDHQSHYLITNQITYYGSLRGVGLILGLSHEAAALTICTVTLSCSDFSTVAQTFPHVLIRRRYFILLGVIQLSNGRIQHHTSHKQPLMIIYFEFQIGPCLSCLIFWGL